MQDIVWVGDVIRFRKNAIVSYMLNEGERVGLFDLNRLAILGFSKEDHMQLAQLIGYSVSGYGDLSFVSEESVAKADAIVDKMIEERDVGSQAGHERAED